MVELHTFFTFPSLNKVIVLYCIVLFEFTAHYECMNAEMNLNYQHIQLSNNKFINRIGELDLAWL